MGNFIKLNAERNVESKSVAYRVLERTWDSMCSWVRSHLCDILEQHLAAFCPCSEDLSETEYRSKVLIFW